MAVGIFILFLYPYRHCDLVMDGLQVKRQYAGVSRAALDLQNDFSFNVNVFNKALAFCPLESGKGLRQVT